MADRHCKRVLRHRLLCLAVAGTLTAGLAAENERALVLHLPFDGTAEPAVGKQLGTPKVVGQPTYVEGKHGQAICLTDGVHLVVPLPPAIKQGEFTIAFWMKPLWHAQDDMPHPILDIPATPESYDQVGWAPRQLLISKGWSETIAPNHFYGVVDPGGAMQHLKPNTWVHITLGFSASGSFRVGYVNGEGMRRPEKSLEPPYAYQNLMWLGSRADGKGGADIILDDVRVYNYAATQADVSAIAGVEFPPPRDYLLLGTRFEPDKVVETPHTKWAKPYAGGRLRIICIGEGVRARDFAELTQRLDAELIAVTGPPINGFTLKNPESFQAMGRQVEAHLEKGGIDCVVLGSFGWNLFQESTRAAILDFVRTGGGVLFAAPRCAGPAPGEGRSTNAGAGLWLGWANTPEGKPVEAMVDRLDRVDEEYLTATIPWHRNTHFATHMERQEPWMLFRGGTCGKGRVLLYDVHTDSTYGWVSLTPALCWMGSFDALDYDYAVGVAAKAVLWAAGRDSLTRIQSVCYGTSYLFFRKVPIGLQGRWQVTVMNLGTQPVRAQIRLRVRTRVPAVPFTAERGITLQPGPNRIDLKHTMDRIGCVFADASVVIDGKVADWASAAVKTVHGNPWFTGLTADQEAYSPGDRPRITARFALKTYGKAYGEAGALKWRLLDCYGRVSARGDREVTFNPYDQMAAEATWSLPAMDGRNLSCSLIVDLVRKDTVTDQRVLVLRCLRQKVDDFIFCSYSGPDSSVPNGIGAVFMRDRYGLDGVGVHMSGNPLCDGPDLMTDLFRASLDAAVKLNLRPWVYATHLGGGFDQEKQRDVDWSDPRFRSDLHDELQRIARLCQPYSPLFYSLGDEVKQGPPEAGPSGHETEAFRRFLKRKYGTIDALNGAWQSEYKLWRDITAPTPEVRASGAYDRALVTELRSFRDTMFADLVDVGVQAIQSVDPGAHVGTEGIFGLTHHYGSFDYSKLCRTATFMGQYALGMEMDMVRSFQKPDDLLGCWYNYRKLDREYSLFGPWHVLLRGCRVFGWYTLYEGTHYTALNPDFTLFEQFAWTWEELEPLLAGIGKLVLGLQRDHAGVYVLYEQANLDRHSPCFLSMMVMTTLLRDIGLQHGFISSAQIDAGRLAQPEVRALVLPRPFTMRPATATAIKAFVEGGRAVIADESVALSDGFKRYDVSPLQELFPEPSALKGPMLPQAEQDVAAWKAHEKAVGKGATLCFGSVAGDYRRKRLQPSAALMRKVVADFLAARGIAADFTVRPEKTPFLPLDVVSYTDGSSRYTGLQREYKLVDDSPQAFTVTGPSEAHIYDVRRGRYLGLSAKATVELEVARGALLAFLPYKAVGLDLVGLSPAHRQGDRVTLRINLRVEGGKPAGGVLRLEVIDPTGAKLLPLCSKVRSSGGMALTDLQLAHNDPVGTYTLRVTDIATGTAATQQFEVVAAP